MNQIVKDSVCPLDCPDTCSLSITVKDNKVVDVKGSKANPYTAGVICNKVMRSFPEFVHGKHRLTSPLKRTGPRGSGMYEKVSWDDALDLVVAGFKKAIDAYGPQSVLPFNYAGPHGQLAGGSMDYRFFHKMGATRMNRGPLCGGVRGGAYASLFGNAPGMPPLQVLHSDLIVVWGNNITVSNLHLAPVLKEARKAGAKTVIIDPKKIKAAEQCDLYIQIQPGTDVILAMALAAELERKGGFDQDFISEWTIGFDVYMEQARKYSTKDAVNVCKIPKSQFDELVSLYLEARNVAASFGNGMERGRSGGSGLRAAMALQALTGNHGRLGAGVVAKSGVGAPKTPDRLQRPDLIPQNTRVFNILDIANKLQDETLDPPIMATMIYNHNPVATHPDQANLIKALMREDLFIVGCDVVMTDSMAFADVILPASSHFEYHDIFGAYGQNYIQRAEPVIPQVGESLPNTEIFRRLALRFGYDEPMFKVSDEELINQAMDEKSPYFEGKTPSRMSTKKAIELKGGDEAPLIMCDTVMPATASGKIELFSQTLEDKYSYGVPRFEVVEQDLPFILMTPGSAKRTNATFGNCAESQGVEILEMNPKDAQRLGLENDDNVMVFNTRADVTFKLVITEATKPGVLYSPKGTWRASSETGYTANALIPVDIRTDIEDGACYNETFVDVKKY